MKEMAFLCESDLSTATLSRKNTTTKRHLIGLLPSFTTSTAAITTNKKMTDKNSNNNAPVPSCSTTVTSISSSSTLCTHSTCNATSALPKPIIYSKYPNVIPDYSALRKLFLKFQSKPKHRRDVLNLDLSLWFRNNPIEIYFQQHAAATFRSFWGLKDASKKEKTLDFGRFVLLKWWKSLLNNLAVANQEDKNLYFEFILEIMTRNEFLEFDYIGPFHYIEWVQRHDRLIVKDYRRLLVASLRLAIDKLNQKAVYSNIISFSAKVLALSFFKVPGVAKQLLKTLDTPLKFVINLRKEMVDLPLQQCQQQQFKSNLHDIFPSFLHETMLPDKSLDQSCCHVDYYAQLPLTLSGNWKRRWESDDSELFFSFYRHYHAILRTYIVARYPTMSRFRLYQRNLILTVSPGYIILASYFASKLHLLTQRELCSVTNGGMGINSNNENNFFVSSTALSQTSNIQLNSDELSGCKSMFTSNIIGKPKPLVIATKRYAECMAWSTLAADPDGLYNDMVNVWLRIVIKKTVLTNAEQVFCLFDLLDQTILELQKFPVKLAYFPVDCPFILHTLNIVLSQCDHSITLLRALSFIYTHFQFLTTHAPLLDLLCNRILMNTSIYERLLLHWAKNVRIFFLRCLIWCVGPVWNTESVLWSIEIENMIRENYVNKDFNTCNGYQCWLQWSSLAAADKTEEAQAYRQCALQVHIKLETLIASFHEHFYYTTQEKQKKHAYVYKLASISERPMTHINSDLAFLPSCTISDFFKTTPCLKKSEIKYHFSRKAFFPLRLRTRRLFKEKNTPLKKYSEKDEKVNKTDALNKEEYGHNDDQMEGAILSREIYTVANEYNVYSLSYPLPLQAHQTWKPNMYIDKDISQSSFIASIVNSWKYDDSTKQVYAKMAVTELKEIVAEYHVWLQEIPKTSEVAFMAPRLILEWPKNWSFSIQ